MLKVYTNKGLMPIENRANYYILLNYSGLHELYFDVSSEDDIFKYLKNESVIENEDNQFLIKSINKRKTSSTFKCELNMDEWKSRKPVLDTKEDAHFQSKLLAEILEYIKPSGWVIENSTVTSIRRTPELTNVTPYDILFSIQDIYSVVYDIDVINKIVKVVDPKSFEFDGLYITPELNMQDITWTGDTSEFCTRLYAYGKKDDTTGEIVNFASINGGKDYVENFSYTNKIISMVWTDERYTVPQNLLNDAKEKLNEICFPVMSYNVTVNDLAKQNEEYSFLTFGLYKKVRAFINEDLSIIQSIVTYKKYYDSPSKNTVTLSTEQQKFTEKVTSLVNSSVNETFKSSILEQAKKDAQYLMDQFSTKGYKYETENETYYLDKLPKENAKYVMRMNLGGIAFSTNGINGPYSTAWTIDGKFNANFITAGILQGVKIICENGTIGGMNISKDGFSIKVPSRIQVFENEYENGYVNFKINAPNQQTNDYNILSFDFTQNDGTVFASGYLKSDMFYCMNINADGLSADGVTVHQYLYAKSATIDSLNQTSVVSKKDNIKLFKQSGLDEIMKTDVYSYLLKSENIKGAENVPKHYGFVIGDGYNISDKVLGRDKDAIDLYNALALAYKAIQEQQEQINKLTEILERKN